ncbi:hypothetical protein NQZ68_030110 [Dissostichus eleginoides]|nr:hypothetical protein NQZ68_030093 [Dissostichus eleginoides]KAI9536888.1 hypothetical protein NQZ68_030110 [Dissostichus eleginoides]
MLMLGVSGNGGRPQACRQATISKSQLKSSSKRITSSKYTLSTGSLPDRSQADYDAVNTLDSREHRE